MSNQREAIDAKKASSILTDKHNYCTSDKFCGAKARRVYCMSNKPCKFKSYE